MIMRKCDIFTEKKNYSYSCSVAISTYNGEEYIQKQLESLRNQSHMVDEVIITDDGSSDKTVQIVQQFIDDNLLQGWHLIQNSNNLGYTKNFEKCVSLWSGDIIFLCDQDDIWVTEKVQRVLEVFEKHSDCQSVVTNFKLIDAIGNSLVKSSKDNCWCYSKKMERLEDNLYRVDLTEVLNHNVAPGCTQAIKNELVKDFLNCKYATTHDYRLSLLASLNNALYYIDEPLIMYRIHGKNNIGYPSFCLLRKNGDRFKIIKSYIIYFYNALRKNNQLEYHRTEKIEWLDNYFGENMNVVRWVLFAKNREKLYSSEKNRVCYYIIQQIKYRRELKTVTFTNDRYERFMLFVNDLAVLFEKDTTLLQK